MTRRLLVAVVLICVGCGAPARDEARDSLVQQLKDGGLDQRTADCVVDAFFEDKSDAELEGFFDRQQLTPEEAAEFAALGQQCLPPVSDSTATTP